MLLDLNKSKPKRNIKLKETDFSVATVYTIATAASFSLSMREENVRSN